MLKDRPVVGRGMSESDRHRGEMKVELEVVEED